MGINSTEVAYNFGQLGSMLNTAASAITPPAGKVFIAITFLTDTTFSSTLGMVAANDMAAGLEYFSTAGATLGEGGAAVVVGDTFAKGITIYGRWNKLTTAAGSYIAYLGE